MSTVPTSDLVSAVPTSDLMSTVPTSDLVSAVSAVPTSNLVSAAPTSDLVLTAPTAFPRKVSYCDLPYQGGRGGVEEERMNGEQHEHHLAKTE